MKDSCITLNASKTLNHHFKVIIYLTPMQCKKYEKGALEIILFTHVTMYPIFQIGLRLMIVFYFIYNTI